jgi:hypothetical protein
MNQKEKTMKEKQEASRKSILSPTLLGLVAHGLLVVRCVQASIYQRNARKNKEFN